MIPDRYKRFFESSSNNESWEAYSKRLNVTDKEEKRYFIRHVIFDHFSNFTGRFPWFSNDVFTYRFENWKADQIHETVKYDRGEELDFWYDHVKLNPDPRLTLLKYMFDEKTWPTPVVIFDFSENPEVIQNLGDRITPIHLIEGTHRVSYLKKMLIMGLIDGKSKHKILVLRKKL